MHTAKFYFITKDDFYESCEFNGHMFPGINGYGDTAFRMIKRIRTPYEFKTEVLKFNSRFYGYPTDGDGLITRHSLDILPETIKIDHEYFTQNDYIFWQSDWTIVKNIGQRIYTILLDGIKYKVRPNRTIMLYTGHIPS